MRLRQHLTPSLCSILLIPFLSLQIRAASSQLPALTDTAGANKPAALSTSSPKKAASKTAAASNSNNKAANAKTTAAATKPTASGSALPGLTSSGTDLGGLVTGLPPLAGYDYPAPTVPPTAGAPFMQKSHLPEGTVFICVGAALAFIGLVILAWRGIVAWTLHRSVRKSALSQSSKYTYIGTGMDSKKGLGGGVSNLGSKLTSPFAGSTLTLDQLRPLSSSKGGAGGVSSKLSAPASRNSLFFSPTAGAGSSLKSPPTSNRGSAYLPAGYYASGQSQSQQQQQQQQNHTRNSISLSNLNPHPPPPHKRTSRVLPSPPSSRPSTAGMANPGLNLSTTALAGQPPTTTTATPSRSSLNIPGGSSESRAPSAYLEELFESAAPPPPVTSHAAPEPDRERELEEEDRRRRRRRRSTRGQSSHGVNNGGNNVGEEGGENHRRRRRSSHGHGHGHSRGERAVVDGNNSSQHQHQQRRSRVEGGGAERRRGTRG